MTKGSDNEFPSVLFGELASAPATPGAGNWRLYTKSDGLYLVDDAGTPTGPFATGAGGLPSTGWVASGAMTFAAADDPTFTATMSGDVSGTYSVGMKIRLAQSTGGTKYFIITKVAVSGDTTLTLYGGTDYNLEDEAISNPYYSPVKAPFGFPLDPTKWTVRVTDITVRTQATPTQSVWYNLGSVSISIPIGAWHVSYQVHPVIIDAATASWILSTTLSTANNSASDVDFTIRCVSASVYILAAAVFRSKDLVLTTKTPYYLNTMAGNANTDNIHNANDSSPLIIEAVCAYL